MQKDNILVTGGAGYIGSHTAKALFEASFVPITLDNLSTGHKSFVKWGPFIEADLLDKAALIKTLNEYQPKAIIHFAAASTVSESVTNPSKYYLNNVIGTFNLLEALKETQIVPFIFSSTCAVYGDPQFLPLTEEHPKNPISPYGSSKLAVESMINDYAKAYQIPFAILRYFNAAGASLDSSIGECHDEENHLIPLVIEAALKKRAHVSIFGTDFNTQDGSAIRDFIHVEDLAIYHVLALKHLLSKKENLTLNLGTGKGTSVKEIIDTLQKLFNIEIPTLIKERRTGDPQELLADPKKSIELLNYTPQFSSINTILQTAFNWHKRNL